LELCSVPKAKESAQIRARAIYDQLQLSVVIVSNKGEASVHDILTHFGMHDFVGLVIAAHDASATKPDPRSYFERIAPVLGPRGYVRSPGLLHRM
jgi:FMN phosphatase YigB (HAD superfamily)